MDSISLDSREVVQGTHLEHDALLGIHEKRLQRNNAEDTRVEAGLSFQEPAHPSLFSSVCITVRTTRLSSILTGSLTQVLQKRSTWYIQTHYILMERL